VPDVLDLADGTRLAVVTRADGLAALPQVREPDGSWRRARPGDGAAEALLALLHDTAGTTRRGRFTVHAWAPPAVTGERAVTVDQTNESVIVGDAAVVKWATHLQKGPHPAPHRIEVLRANGFRFMPTPWGLITWSPDGGAETMVVNVDEYLPGAVDGWTWAVDLLAAAARDRTARPAAAVSGAAEVGTVVAELHSALAGTATTASAVDADRWRDAAFATLKDARALASPELRDVLDARQDAVEQTLTQLGGLAGCPVIEGHGDLHVGQVLRCAGRFVVTDFDGNPVLPPQQRVLAIPAALDVAGMVQSLAHVAIVARRHNDLDTAALAVVDGAARQAFLDTYARHLAALGHADLFDPAPLRAFRLQQVLREVIYAAKHLPRWMYVADAALPALLDERIPGEP
jgi:maltokinase